MSLENVALVFTIESINKIYIQKILFFLQVRIVINKQIEIIIYNKINKNYIVIFLGHNDNEEQYKKKQKENSKVTSKHFFQLFYIILQ